MRKWVFNKSPCKILKVYKVQKVIRNTINWKSNKDNNSQLHERKVKEIFQTKYEIWNDGDNNPHELPTRRDVESRVTESTQRSLDNLSTTRVATRTLNPVQYTSKSHMEKDRRTRKEGCERTRVPEEKDYRK